MKRLPSALILVLVILALILLKQGTRGPRAGNDAKSPRTPAASDTLRSGALHPPSLELHLAMKPQTSQRRAADLEPAPQEAPPPRPWLTVEVVDAEQRPLEGVALALLTWDAVEIFVCLDGTTGADGRWVIEERPEDPDWTGEEFIVGPVTALSTPREVRFPAEGLAEIVRLQLEPTGSVELVAVDPSGRPMEREVDFFLQVVAKGEMASPAFRFWVSLESSKGRGQLAWIGLDLPLELDACSEGLDFETVLSRGPRLAGERVRIQIPLEHVRPRLSGRVLAPEAIPIRRNLELELMGRWSVDEGEGVLDRWSVHLDPDGRFERFARIDLHGATRWRLRGKASEHAIPLEGHAAALPPRIDPASFDRELYELGDVHLTPLPVLVCGQVADSGGRLLGGATVWVRPAPSDAEAEWHRAAESDADGGFSVCAPVPWRELDVCASITGEPSIDVLTVPAGAIGIRLVAREERPKVGSIRGSWLLPPGLEVSYVDLWLKAEDGEWRRDCDQWSEERFLVKSLRPGTWSLRIHLFEDEAVLAERLDITVEGGRTTLLEPIDLRSRLETATIRIVASSGDPIPEASAMLVSGGATFSAREDGHVTVSASGRPLDLVLGAPGHRPLHVLDVTEGSIFVLQPGIEVLFRLPTAVQVPPGFEVEIEASHTDSWLMEEWARRVYLELHAQPTRLPLAGRYAISLRLKDGKRRYRGGPVGEGEIVVLDDGIVREHELPIDAAALEELLRQL